MIFEGVKHIRNKEEFNEKILVYIRLVEVLAKRDKITIPNTMSPSSEVIREMIDMGVIDTEEEISDFKKVSGTNYVRFLSSVSFFLSHQKIYGDLLDKLNNKKRKKLQDKEKDSDKKE